MPTPAFLAQDQTMMQDPPARSPAGPAEGGGGDEVAESLVVEDPSATHDGLTGGIEHWFADTLANWETWAWLLGKIAIAVVVGLIIHAIVFWVAIRLVRRTRFRIDDVFLTRVRRPSRLIFPLLAVQVTLPTMAALSEGQMEFLRHLISLGTIAAITWLGIAILNGFEDAIKTRHRIDIADNYASRRIHTQITVLKRTIAVFIFILGVSAALMTFPRVREFGASILVSAGFAGLAIGLAARPVLENLIAGIQIALTQPINLDDVVIISDEWGRIEEITSTYVVVRIWDQRRLIVPFSKIINEPFQNWTRRTAEILGTVFIYTDYSVPVQAVRDELQRLVKENEKWDGKTCVLQVTDAKESTLELRALMSAANSGDSWDLRVWVREQLIAFLQAEHPGALPRSRVEIERPPEQGRDGQQRARRPETASDPHQVESAEATIGTEEPDIERQ